MLNLKLLVLVGLIFTLTGCGKSKQEEAAEAQLNKIQEDKANSAENQKKKDASLKALTGGDGPTWNFDSGKK
jgi:ABC-type uncharacterized transport system auxiliary subunit